MQTKEQLLYHFLAKKLRLHYSDRKFFNNLTIIIKEKNTITTGQNTLFDKLVIKYAPQLKDTKLDSAQLQALPWKCNVVQTSSNYTSAKLSLTSTNTLTITAPTNKKFIRKFDDLADNTFKWNSKDKRYESAFNTLALKIANALLPVYFSDVRYCDNIQKLLDAVPVLDQKVIWQPTLLQVNSMYVIACSNEHINQQLAGISLSNHPKVLYEVSKLGVTIDVSVHNNDPFLKFASEYVTEVDIGELTTVVQWVERLGVDHVLMGRGVHTAFHSTKSFFKDMVTELKQKNIAISQPGFDSNFEHMQPILFQYHGDERMRFFGRNSLGKCVFIKNTQPINVQ